MHFHPLLFQFLSPLVLGAKLQCCHGADIIVLEEYSYYVTMQDFGRTF